jgi:4-amino-4-deoxy-L-arabinose transferase-like glycosyltransferase
VCGRKGVCKLFALGSSALSLARSLGLGIAMLFGLTVYRAAAGFFDPLPLQVDEAQYVGWAHFLAAGYYSKPPFIAWAIAGGQGVCSALQIVNTEGCVRLLQPPAFFIAALGVMGSAYQITKNTRCATSAAVIFITMPLVGFYALFVTTDAWLLMFWSLALWALLVALEAQKYRRTLWILCGVLVGLGMLSKYSMAAFLIAAFFYLLWAKRLREVGPWLAILAALLTFLPNLLWNIENQFPTFYHHFEIAQIVHDSPGGLSVPSRFLSAASFVSSQLGLFGPLFFIALLFSLRVLVLERRQRYSKMAAPSRMSDKNILMHLMTWLILALALLQAFSSRSFANWAAPAYVSGSLLVAQMLSSDLHRGGRQWRKFTLVFSLALGLSVSALLVHMPKLIFWSTASDAPRIRALEKLRGWNDVGTWAKHTIAADSVVVAEDRRLLAAIAAYGYPAIQTPYAWNPQDRRDSHYNWFLDVRGRSFKLGQRFVLLQLVKPGLVSAVLMMPGFRIVQEIDTAGLAFVQLGADNERLVAYELIREQ